MSRNKAFVRKVTYITAIAVLLLPLAALSQPATVSRGGGSPGGKLAQLRTEYNLAQAELGEIDPASETMKLATLGLRGVAANVLWIYANHYKKVEDWDKLELTVQQIIRLQPNFLEVWDFQAHNLSYNVSVEFDDYRMRYQWVKKGIDFLILGTHYNRQEPGLLNEVGWFTGQKVGRSDEQKQFRRMFRDDEDFHDVFRKNGVEVDQPEAIGADGKKPDNWLVARLWFNKATDAVTFSGKPIRGKSPLLFYSGGPMAQINGSAAMQKDGYFFQRAQIAWATATREWKSYGNRELPTSSGYSIHLNDKEDVEQRIARLRSEIDQLVPGGREELKKQKAERLSPAMRAALDKPAAQRTGEEASLGYQAEVEIRVSDRDLIDRAPREDRPKMRTLVEQIEADQNLAMTIARDRQIVNFEYWRTRCEAEMTDLTQGARDNVYKADQLFAAGDKFEQAKQKYEEAWQAWAKIFAQYPVLMDNAEAQDLIDSVQHYHDLLGQLDEKFPADFPLNNLLDMHEKGRHIREKVRLLNEGSGGATKPEIKKLEGQNIEVKPPEAKKPDDKPAAKPADSKPTTEKPAAEKPAAEKSKGAAAPLP